MKVIRLLQTVLFYEKSGDVLLSLLIHRTVTMMSGNSPAALKPLEPKVIMRFWRKSK